MILKLISILCFAIFVSPVSSQIITSSKDCPTAWQRDRHSYISVHNNVCYQFHLGSNDDVVYPTAQRKCQQNGGTLVMVKNSDVTNYLVNELHGLDYSQPVWIGLTDINVENKFFWADGTPLSDTGYSNWGRREGSDGGAHRRDDCVYLGPSDGKWHDVECEPSGGLLGGIFGILSSKKYGYICQFGSASTLTVNQSKTTTKSTIVTKTITNTTVARASTTTSLTTITPVTKSSVPTEVSTLPDTLMSSIASTSAHSFTVADCPSDVQRYGHLRVKSNYCYQFRLNTTYDYPTAKKDCQWNGGILAVVKDHDTNRFLVDTLLYELNHTQKVWIGLQDMDMENVFYWEDGSALMNTGYSNWGYGRGPAQHPHEYNDCVCLNPLDGRWDDAVCQQIGLDGGVTSNHYAHICQYKINV